MRYLENLAPLTRYLEIKGEIRQLEEELKALQPLITAALMEEPEQRYEHLGYQLELGQRRSYAYSEAVQALQEELRALKKREEQQGIAVLKKHVTFPVVRSKKT